MSIQKPSFQRLAATVITVAAFMPIGAAESQTPPPIVQPGAPGEPSRRISVEEASDLVASTKRAALNLFADKELAYDLIYKPRLQRLMLEKFRLH